MAILFLVYHSVWEKPTASLWAALWGGPCGQELRRLANWSQDDIEASRKTAPWMNLEMHAGNCSLRDILSARTGPRRYSCLPDSVKIINICCFKMLSLGTIFMQQQITKTISFRKKKKERKHPLYEGKGTEQAVRAWQEIKLEKEQARSHGTFSA